MDREIKRILWLEEVIKLADISELNDYTAVVVPMKPSKAQHPVWLYRRGEAFFFSARKSLNVDGRDEWIQTKASLVEAVAGAACQGRPKFSIIPPPT